MSHIDQTLRRLLELKLNDLVSVYGLSRWNAKRIPPASPVLCSVLGFSSEHLRGAVVVTATLEAISDTNPASRSPARAWIAELTNQLVGRFKNELVRFGVEISVATPIVFATAEVTPLSSRRTDPIVAGIDAGVLSVWAELDYDDELSFAPTVAEVMPEGTAILF